MDKSELKKAYKQSNRPMGVYRITNTENNRVYIGYGTDIQAKINRHKAELKFGNHRNRELQDAWNSFGESAFEFEVLDVLDHEEDSQTDPAEELQILAEMWIKKLEKAGDSIERLQKIRN
jgi:group I intron endonuclease